MKIVFLKNEQNVENFVNKGIDNNNFVQVELNVKSRYIFKKILDNLPKRRLLDIIRCNKKIKKIMNINIIFLKNIQKYIHQYLLLIKTVNLLISIAKMKNIIIYILITIKKK